MSSDVKSDDTTSYHTMWRLNTLWRDIMLNKRQTMTLRVLLLCTRMDMSIPVTSHAKWTPLLTNVPKNVCMLWLYLLTWTRTIKATRNFVGSSQALLGTVSSTVEWCGVSTGSSSSRDTAATWLAANAPAGPWAVCSVNWWGNVHIMSKLDWIVLINLEWSLMSLWRWVSCSKRPVSWVGLRIVGSDWDNSDQSPRISFPGGTKILSHKVLQRWGIILVHFHRTVKSWNDF